MQRTLTNLYNQRPASLEMAHRRLDEAALDAYGWPRDVGDEEVLARLLAPNGERAARRGLGLTAAPPRRILSATSAGGRHE